MNQTTHNGRTFNLTENKAELPALRADLKTRGFDGTIWHGESLPVGRQRKTFVGLFYRSAKDQSFQFIA